jgi:AraC-like DNA-binding protein
MMNSIATLLGSSLIFFISFTVVMPQAGKSDAAVQSKEIKLSELYRLFNETYRDSANAGYKYALEALTLSREIKNAFYEVEALNYLGRRECIRFKYESAKMLLLKAYKISLTTGNDYLVAHSCWQNGWNYLQIGMADSAVFFCRKGYELAVKINNQRFMEYMSMNLASSYILAGDKTKALEYCKKSLVINKYNMKNSASINHMLSVIYGDIGRLEDATSYLLRSVQFFKELQDYSSLGYPYYNLSLLYKNLNNKKEEEKYLKLAIDAFEKTNDLRGLGYVYNGVGMNILADEPQKAMQSFQKSLKYRKLINEWQGISFTEGNIAMAFRVMENPDSAFYHLNNSLKAANVINDPLALAQSYLAFADYYNHFSFPKKAIEYSLNALARLKEIKFLESEEKAYDIISDSYNRLGDSRNSLYYLKLKNEVHDTLYTQEMRKSVLNLRMKYDVEEKDKELAALEAKKTNLESKVVLHQIITLITILGSILIVGFILFYYRNKIVMVVRFLKTIPMRGAEDKRRIKAVMKAIETQSEIPETKHIDSRVSENLLFKLNELMINEKVFLNPQITQQEIARRLNTNTAYLSRLINDNLSSNFSNYVNGYRIEEAKKLLMSNKENNLSFEGIGQVVGFNSKSAFNYAFKKATGKTPTQYALENNSGSNNSN